MTPNKTNLTNKILSERKGDFTATNDRYISQLQNL